MAYEIWDYRTWVGRKVGLYILDLHLGLDKDCTYGEKRC